MRETKGTIRWARNPSEGLKPLDNVVKVEGGPPKEWTILSERMVGVWTHFIDGRTMPCVGEECECWRRKMETSLRWQGWFAVCQGVQRQIQYLALTDGAVRDCPELAAERSMPGHRGRVIAVGRKTKTPQSKMVAYFTLASYPSSALPAAPSVEAFLLRLWGCKDDGASPMCDPNSPKSPTGLDPASEKLEIPLPQIGAAQARRFAERIKEAGQQIGRMDVL